MKQKLIDTLTFFRLVDAHDGLLSLTNLALIVVLVKLCAAPATSISDVGNVFLVLAAYSAKKIINKNKTEEPEEDNSSLERVEAEVKELKAKLSSHAMALGFKSLKGE